MSRLPLAILTGATGGIGQAVAPLLAERGYRVALLGRNHDVLDELLMKLGKDRAVAISLDLVQERQPLASIVGPVIEDNGPVEVLVNNAGAGEYRPFLEQSPQRHRELMQLNYLAAAELIHLVLPKMVERGSGHVINIASMAALIGPWGHSGYAGAKAALVSLTQTLDAEYAHTGVCFCSLCPGFVDTGFFRNPQIQPLWRKVRSQAMSPDRVAAKVMNLIDRPRLIQTIPCHYRMLDWIRALSPRLAHRLVARQSRPGPE